MELVRWGATEADVTPGCSLSIRTTASTSLAPANGLWSSWSRASITTSPCQGREDQDHVSNQEASKKPFSSSRNEHPPPKP